MRVAMTVGTTMSKVGIVRRVVFEGISDEDAKDVDFEELDGIINSDLSIGMDLTSVKPLKANLGICSRGVIPVGQGFVVDWQQAVQLGVVDEPELSKHIRKFYKGKDITALSRDTYIIDLFGLSEMDVLTQYPKIYQHIFDNVKPQRDLVRREATKKKWWIFAEPRSKIRPALSNIPRYLATVYVAKHRFFTFVDSAVLPDDTIVVIALDDAYWLGTLSSIVHEVWAMSDRQYFRR